MFQPEQFEEACRAHLRSKKCTLYSRFFNVVEDGPDEAVEWLSTELADVLNRMSADRP